MDVSQQFARVALALYRLEVGFIVEIILQPRLELLFTLILSLVTEQLLIKTANQLYRSFVDIVILELGRMDVDFLFQRE